MGNGVSGFGIVSKRTHIHDKVFDDILEMSDNMYKDLDEKYKEINKELDEKYNTILQALRDHTHSNYIANIVITGDGDYIDSLNADGNTLNISKTPIFHALDERLLETIKNTGIDTETFDKDYKSEEYMEIISNILKVTIEEFNSYKKEKENEITELNQKVDKLTELVNQLLEHK